MSVQSSNQIKITKITILNNLKYKACFELFHTVLFTTLFHMCSFIVLNPSLRTYNVNSPEN